MTKRRIVVLRSGALGDHVVTLPAVELLRHNHPGRDLWWIGHPARGRLARPEHLIDADGPLGAALHADPPPEPHLVALLQSADHVLLYSATPAKLSHRLAPLCPGLLTAWDPRPPGPAPRHITAHLCDALTGSAAAAAPPRLALTTAEIDHGRACWRDAGLPPSATVVLHPGSGAPHKCWPLPRFARLGQQLEEMGLQIAILKGPAENDLGMLPHRWPTVGATAPLHLAAILASVRLFIGNDSGPGHLAAAVGTPTLSLFGPTDPAVWRPLGPASHVVQSPTSHMDDLSVEAVLAACQRLGPAG